MWAKPLDTRRKATAAELEIFCAAADDPFWDFGDFLLWGNPRFARLKWRSLSDRAIKRLPVVQRVVLVMHIVDGEINNGGIEQLFFNHVYDMEIIAHDVDAFGWEEFTTRFRRQYDAVFGSKKRDFIENLNRRFQAAVARGGDHNEAWVEFRKVYAEVPGDELNDWYHEEPTKRQFNVAMLQFIRDHEPELIALAADD
ncbi:MAG: DUF4375 domain-containing protein [Hyphomonadaceae bacterium]